ncbi:unnamed protein product [Periconia digitata]|uniref:Methyltransferase domain-containing protein n=1 Tax=Periconia digitata TaxID=1303443 RepID=A0A9W4UH79_9PLEO|nr:unnamed protein product [Periconia digitata]
MSPFSDPYVAALQSFYNATSEKYTAQSSSFHNQSASHLVEAAGPAIQEGSWVLDLATGTGNVAFASASKVGSAGRVIGIDISDQMLAFAAQRAQQENLKDRVQFFHQDVTNMNLSEHVPLRRFDALTCGSAIAMFPDHQAVLRAASTQILKPGGVFVADMHGTHVPARIFLEVAIPRGFNPPFDAAWIDKTEECLVKLFDNSLFEVKYTGARDIGSESMKWDVSSVEATEKLWMSVVDDSPWLTFGLQNLPREVIAEIKEEWVKSVVQHSGLDGYLSCHMKQYVVVAQLRPT